MDIVARRYGTLPSAIMGLPPGSWEAWNLDIASAAYGIQEEAEAHKPGRGRNRDKSDLKAIVEANNIPDEERFASFSGLPMKKMEVPESGVW
jgi:hypothetical protein